MFSGEEATSGRAGDGFVCKDMHGQYGLRLHAPSITACIAWGLHYKWKKHIHLQDNFAFFFLVHVHNVYLNVILVLCHMM